MGREARMLIEIPVASWLRVSPTSGFVAMREWRGGTINHRASAGTREEKVSCGSDTSSHFINHLKTDLYQVTFKVLFFVFF